MSNTTTLKVPGRHDRALQEARLVGGDFAEVVRVQVAEAVTIDPGRAGEEPVRIEGLAADDVVELILEGGVRQVLTVERLLEDYGEQLGRLDRGAVAGEIELPTELRVGEASRGAGEWILKGLRILKVDVAGEAADKVAELLEAKLAPGPGLYRCPSLDRLEPLGDGPIPVGKPILLFLHGTASRTLASFGDLATADGGRAWRELEKRYGERIYAFEHETLTKSPIENAVELLRSLPVGVQLHVVSHSRGGLVGELVARGSLAENREPFDATDRKLFADRQDHDALVELGELLVTKRPRVERFVRVACPASGTTLASRRLDRYLNVLVNLLGLIPGLRSNPVYDFSSALLVAVVKKRTDPEELPGLEAMMPTSPVIRLLNRPGVAVKADLSVIAGDTAGRGILGTLKTLATDFFFSQDHDLVVNTISMSGGTERVDGFARRFFDQGPDVNHFRYFQNTETAQKLLDALARTEESSAGFEPIVVTHPEVARSYPARSAGPAPVVFVLPGLLGTHLSVENDRIWLDPKELAKGGFERLAIDAVGVRPDQIIGRAYLDLVEFLAATHEVIPFPYDWRRSLVEEARRLADAVERKLEETVQPVRLLAHSMGGLLARIMIAERPDVWGRFAAREGSRLVMLGTPNGGSWVVPRALLGREKIIRYLELLDFEHGPTEIPAIISRFPGFLELLPVDGERDFFSLDTWRALHEVYGEGWVLPRPADLEAAREVRKLLDRSPIQPERMAYVAGQAPATPIGIDIDPDAKRPKRRLRFRATWRGDGRVPWSSGPPTGVATWYLPAPHGQLAEHRPSFSALAELLETGRTDRLPMSPPAPMRALEESFELPDDEPDLFPDTGELESAAVGFELRVAPERPVEKVRLSVVHGNLSFARYPVAVGHYEGDMLVGAEAHMDARLDGRLRRRRELGLYPGRLESAEVLLQAEQRPPGAVVVGLGKVGELSPGDLKATLSHALLQYALKVLESSDGGAPTTGRRSARLSTLLIGSSEGGLPLADVVNSLLRAIEAANRELAKAKLDDRVRIEEIEILELYKDRAVEAARELQRASGEAGLAGLFEVGEEVRRVPGGRRRVFADAEASWWRRLQIRRSERDDSLVFTALTDRARAEQSLLAPQRALLDGYIAQAMRSTAWSRESAGTLFELLVPNRLKEYAPDERRLVLVIDQDAARYPWELLSDPLAGEGEQPIAVRTAMIRQLIEGQFRARPAMVTEAKALVIGDPPSRFQRLLAAEREASQVAGLLQQDGFQVTAMIRRETAANLNALFSDSYRVLHVAAHGVFRHGDEKVTGMVLGDDAFLTPEAIEQLRRVPELVFLNCCHLGRIEAQDAAGSAGRGPAERAPELEGRPEIASNLAWQLIRMGARAVVAAGWAVNDAAAAAFAETFYRCLLGGYPFGDAVLEARAKAFKDHDTTNTWGAYQCYGDPDYRLRPSQRRLAAPQHPGGKRWVDPEELLIELENLAEDAVTAAVHGLAPQRERLAKLVEEIPVHWLARAEILAALGRAHSELDLFPQAVSYYERALCAEQASFPAQAIEQLANLEGRWAVVLKKERSEASTGSEEEERTDQSRVLGSGGERRVPEDLLDSAELRLTQLLALCPTVERLSLLGSLNKQRAQVVSEAELRDAALKKMAECYEKAHRRALEASGGLDPYPLLNWLAAEVVHGWRTRRSGLADLEHWTRLAAEQADKKDREDPSFWHLATVADCALLRGVASGELVEHRREILDLYRRAWARGGTPRMARTVLEHVDFFVATLEVAEDEERGKRRTDKEQEREALCRTLESLRQELARAFGMSGAGGFHASTQAGARDSTPVRSPARSVSM